MYRLLVRRNRHWTWGVQEYNTVEEAENRVKELASFGIKAKVASVSELFN